MALGAVSLYAMLAVAAEHPCARCHPAETAAYLKTPMGRALARPVGGESGRFTHAASGTAFTARSEGAGLWQGAERQGLRAEYPVEYVIGSGEHAKGFLVRLGEQLFQSPISYYRRAAKLDVAPGYERMERPDFNRRATPECLACHSSGAVSSSSVGSSSLSHELTAITCDRCHGPAEAHLAAPGRATIVNPSRLPAAQRDSVCEQCHLNGEARVANPGQDLIRFRPGEALEERWQVFVYDRPRGDLRVVSHAEQLALSSCAKASAGQLWCGSCHQPHGEKVNVDAQCRRCHTAPLSAAHPKQENCAGCHMPQRGAADGGHTAFTDHRIQRVAAAPFALPTGAEAPAIRAWREPADATLSERNRGLASIMVGERDGEARLINDGYRRLAAVYAKFPRDADVLAGLGMVLFLKDQHRDAVKLLQAAVAARPGDAGLREKLAVVLNAAGDKVRAVEALEKAIALDPLRETAYHLRAAQEATPAGRKQVLERWLAKMPQSLVTREALRDLARQQE
jgi:tetratricopeptide (TPR) repeat protein